MDLAAGDRVLAYDEATGATAPSPVTAVHAHTDSLITTVTIDGEDIETTPDHPFATQGRGWVPAADLHAGEAVWQRYPMMVKQDPIFSSRRWPAARPVRPTSNQM